MTSRGPKSFLTRSGYAVGALLLVATVYVVISFLITPLPFTPFFLVVVRWVHFFGAFAAIGAIITGVIIVAPALQRLPAELRGPSLAKLLHVIILVHVYATDLLMIAGSVLAGIISWLDLTLFVTTKWGLAVLAAGILTIIMRVNGQRGVRLTGGYGNVEEVLGAETFPGSEVPESGSQVGKIVRTNFVLAMVIMFLMGYAAHG